MFELTRLPASRPLERMRREMNDFWGHPRMWPERIFGEAVTLDFPMVDIKETDVAYEVSAEVPGIKPEDIDISLTGNELTIKGEKKESKEKTEGGYRLEERSYGRFARSFRLPTAVNHEKVAADHKDGVVLITLPKSEKAATQKIKIKD
jgi:HSP20 family protein